MAAKRKKSDDISFSGFSKPESNYFKMPNDWPNITAKITSLAELKVVEYVLRHTWGYEEYGISKKITTDEFMNGRKRLDETRIDKGTGLSNRSVIDGLRRAVAHGLLVEEVDDSDKARVKKRYKLKMKSFQEDPQSGVKKVHTGVKKLHSNCEETSQRSERNTIERNKYVVVKDLIDRGISPNVAHELYKDYPEDYLHKKIELLDYLVETRSPLISRNSAGYLRTAITEDYIPPKGFKTKAEREIEETEERRLLEGIDEELRAEQEKEHTRREQIIATYQIPETALNIWERALDQLRGQFSRVYFDTWVKDSILLSIENGVATIGVENRPAQEWLSDRAQSTVVSVLTGLLGEPISVSFEVLH